eukprot:Nk52_evm52s208 gene=Nk52_evmTU52s208
MTPSPKKTPSRSSPQKRARTRSPPKQSQTQATVESSARPHRRRTSSTSSQGNVEAVAESSSPARSTKSRTSPRKASMQRKAEVSTTAVHVARSIPERMGKSPRSKRPRRSVSSSVSASEDPPVIARVRTAFSSFMNEDPTSGASTSDKSELRLDSSEFGGFGLDSVMEETGIATSEHVQTLIEAHRKETSALQRDVVHLKAKCVALEGDLSDEVLLRKSKDIEHERELSKREGLYLKETEKVRELEEQRRFLLEEEKLLKDEVKKLADKCVDVERRSKQEISDMNQKELNEVMDLRGELEEQSEVNEALLAKCNGLEGQYVEVKNQLDQKSAEVEMLSIRARGTEAKMAQAKVWEEKSDKLQKLVRELEKELEQSKDDVQEAQQIKRDVAKMGSVERQLGILSHENAAMKDKLGNTELLKLQLEESQKKCARLEERVEKLVEVELKYEDIKENGEGGGNAAGGENAAQLSDLRKQNALLVENVATLMQEKRMREAVEKKLSQDLEEKSKELVEAQHKERSFGEHVKRLERKLMFITKERDGIKKILESYDEEDAMSSNYDKQKKDRIEELEANLEQCHKQIETLEASSAALEEKNNALLKRVNETSEESERKSGVYELRVQVLTTELEALRKKCGELKSKNESVLKDFRMVSEESARKAAEEKNVKVLHFINNPEAIAKAKKVRELVGLREENEALKFKIGTLEKGIMSANAAAQKGGEFVGLRRGSTVEGTIAEDALKENRTLKEKLKNAEKKNQRLKEVFSEKTQEFRTACYLLLGYKIEMSNDGQYTLRSMYGESDRDYLLFKVDSKGGMTMLETEYSTVIGTEKINTFLKNCDSIPSFLSSLTLELFSKSTDYM